MKRGGSTVWLAARGRFRSIGAMELGRAAEIGGAMETRMETPDGDADEN
jgi:hypothetical protein